MWECSTLEENYCSVLLQHLFLLQDSMELSIIAPAFQVGKRGMEEGSQGRTAGPRELGTEPRVSTSPYTFSYCHFLFPCRSGEWDCWRAGEVKVS